MVWGLSADPSDNEFWEDQARHKREAIEKEEREEWEERTKKELKKEILEELSNK